MGFVPPVYNGTGSEELYFQSEKHGTQDILIDAGDTEAEASA